MRNKPVNPIYLDYQATTPCDPRVVDEMLPYFTNVFGNPHSADHRHGWNAMDAVDMARKSVAQLIGATSKEIYFTSGATESNNLAIKSAARYRREMDGHDHVITVATEHKCVLESVKRLESEGFRTTVLPVKLDGHLDLEVLEAALDDKTALVSVMAANNEIGILHPIKEIAALAHSAGAYLHVDAAQAVGKIPVSVKDWGVDLLSISGHKLYGPKGIGALYVTKRPKVTRRITLEPLIDGGGQERGLRSGTLSPALCVGLGKACDIAAVEMDKDAARLKVLRNQMWSALKAAHPHVTLNGDLEKRLEGNLNITIAGVESGEFLAAIDNLSVSSGSACSSGSGAHSHVLFALGHDPATVAAGIRIGLGRFTTAEEVRTATEMLIAAIPKQS